MYDFDFDFDTWKADLYRRNPQAAAFHAQQLAILTDNAYKRERFITSDNVIIFIPIAPTSNQALSKVISNLKKCKKHGRSKKSVQAYGGQCYPSG